MYIIIVFCCCILFGFIGVTPLYGGFFSVISIACSSAWRLETESPRVTRREYWMTYRGPGFLAVVRFGSSPTSSVSLPIAICLSVFLCFVDRAYWQERGGGDGEGAKSYGGEKAWSSKSFRQYSLVPIYIESNRETYFAAGRQPNHWAAPHP